MNNQDEINDNKKNKTSNKRILVLLVLFIVIGTLFGYYLNYSKPITDINKINQIEELLSTRWYFNKEHDDIQTYLEDNALKGMTNLEEDPFTAYMSSQELDQFTTSINNNFVGIGVQYIGTNGLNMVTKVFKDSPAFNAGIKEGDVIFSVDHKSIENLATNEIADMVKGENGSIVNIGVLRDGKELSFDIERGPIMSNTYGYSIDDIGFVQIFSFGESTSYELEKYLLEFKEKGHKKLIIDLRDNGGGFLDSLVDVAGLFLGPDVECMVEEYSNGQIERYKTKGQKIDDYEKVIILVNGNTASAAEVLTLALKEKLPNTTIVGSTTYGKGTVQTTKVFNDGSALKFTVGRWLSPSMKWIHKEGIVPDEVVDAPEIFSLLYPKMEDEIVKVDSVSIFTNYVQKILKFLNYDIDRTDGYFSNQTLEILNKAQRDFNFEVTDYIDDKVYMAFVSLAQRTWSTDITFDNQLTRAIEMMK